MIEMVPEKFANSATHLPILRLTRRAGALAAVAFLAMLLVWSVDHSTITIVLDFWRYPTESISLKLENSPDFRPLSTPQNDLNVAQTPQISPEPRHSTLEADFNSTQISFRGDKNDTLATNRNPDEVLVNPLQNVTEQAAQGGIPSGSGQRTPDPDETRERTGRVPKGEGQDDLRLSCVSAELEQNYTSNLLSRMWAAGGEPCKDSRTVDIKFLNFDDGKPVVLSTGNVHEVVFQAVYESGNSRCGGGDYFEINLAGELWRSRPPTRDLGNGTYSFVLQVHPHFAGVYNLTIILLFRQFEGLKFSTARFAFDKQLRGIPIMFSKSEAKLPELHLCKKSDFNRDFWAGRWTRHAKNDACEISNEGRYRCLEPDYPCTNPWCNGSLGSLESNGWVYSAHCSFRLFSSENAWNCFNNHWLFFWGDSNHVDTVRNILFFFLGVPFKELDAVTRRFDKKFINHKNESQSVRITNIFNGHWDEALNYQGLNSLSNEGHRDLVKSFFNGSAVPDTIIFNSGLHDGIYWHGVKQFIRGAEYAASFWKEILDGVQKRGLEVPNVIFRSTIATGGYARTLPFNPSKMEAFNGILLEKLRTAGLLTGVIDDFDMTWAWHFDNRCNDGVHYGRFPSKSKWRDGQIGHQYFVDLMLGHVLLNAICPI